MQRPLIVALISLNCLTTAENVGQKIGDFFEDVGKGIGNAAVDVAMGVGRAAVDVADGVNQFAMDNQDLEITRRVNNQKAIDAYKRGEINETQLQTALWINQYEYQQAIDDRIRSRYNGGNTYPGYYNYNYPTNGNNANYGSPGYPGYNGYGTSGYNGYNNAQYGYGNNGGQKMKASKKN